MDMVRKFKYDAKRLLRDLKSGDQKAITRIRAVLRDTDRAVTLQRVQHVIAVEQGYRNWKGLLDAHLEGL